MDQRQAPTHPVGSMLGERGWAVVEAVAIAALASVLVFAGIRLMYTSWVESIGRLALRYVQITDWIVLVVTGAVGAAVLSVDSHRPQVRWPDHDRALVVVGAIALLVVTAVAVASTVVSAMNRPSSAVVGAFGALPLWQSIVLTLIGILAFCGRRVGEETLFRAAIQRRLGVLGAPVAIGLTAILHAVFVVVVTGRFSPAVLWAVAGVLLESAIAGVAYERTGVLGPSIVVRFVAPAIVSMLGVVLVVV
ncbi:CPBP family glutamic-type intramembrane protease [Halococcoides cellulosivorans]|uniref:CAAX prenyl protease 2/Lysostaphin resistance protein A-like domain-containing protein n=1 Tax=Halococcoides cellulosivorans TaxID=1679096 RepID=A0A2R4X122_9EURY|nr:CPBP family glutamic-type intramembrane protease [Halococcoides cellulosivorans]AWB27494.1 hypothetical protein HARCEL1_07120 [Halococcoides cellulosivorans]